MSVNTVQNIKQQLAQLSPQERDEINQFLAQQKQRDALFTEPAAALTERERKRQLRAVWLKAHRDEYGGLYVALDGDRLLGTGKNYPEAHGAAKAAGVSEAYIGFVYPENYEGAMGGWA